MLHTNSLVGEKLLYTYPKYAYYANSYWRDPVLRPYLSTKYVPDNTVAFVNSKIHNTKRSSD